jgi:hypothetical protein
MLAMLRESGRKSAPNGRVTSTARPMATKLAASMVTATMPRWLSVISSKLPWL